MQFMARGVRARWQALGAFFVASALSLGGTAGLAQQPAGAVPKAKPTGPAARPAKAAPAKPAAAPVAPPRSGKGWQVGAIPAWVVAPPAPDANAPRAPAVGTRREQLVDLQTNHATPKPQSFVRVRSVAQDAASLGQVSQWQIGFNPAFQTVLIHHASVLRDGQRSERLAEARIEPMRREQRLEQQVLDGGETLLVVLADVRVGDAVEVAYTVEGENPIFEGRISGGMRLAYDTPVDLLHHRWVLPANKTVFTKPLAGQDEAEKFTEASGGQQVQVLRAVRHQVAAIAQEQGTPPWFKVYPAIDISEYARWSEVDAWAQRLFALPSPTPPAVAAKAQALREAAQKAGLKDEALISEALRFVQDEVRYLSVSLGESSHRPKPPEQTLAELLGDCKDKTVLLNTLLRELGFDAKAALVSMQRNRGVRDYLPSHEIFDHVITRVEHQGRVWFLDATINGQGLQLDTRAQYPYGAALVVGAGDALQTVPEPPAAVNRLQFEQRWDLREPGRPVPLVFTMRAIGLPAERWRAGQAQAGVQALSQALGGSFARLLPGLKTVGEPEVQDDRQANRWQFTQRFEVPELGTYNRGAIDAEFGAMELLDVLTGPSETQRRTPFLVDQPRLVESRIEVQMPVALTVNPPAPLEIVERQFRFSARLELQGRNAAFVRRFERRDDQVLPGELNGWREKILQARQGSFGRLRLPLIEDKAVVPELEKIERRVRNARGARNDALLGMQMRHEFSRAIDSQVLKTLPADSPLSLHVRNARAVSHNMLGDHAQALADADAVLALRPDDTEALDARGVALAGTGRAEDAEAALAVFARIKPGARPASVASWMGSLHHMLGRPAAAEPLLREAVANGSGEGREFAMLWLYLAAEAQGSGRGAAAVDEHVEATDAQKLPGAMLRFLLGRIDRAALLKQASAAPEMERLNLAEAHFFIGQKLLLQGQRDEAMRAFQRCLDTGATPYRELSFARMAMQAKAR